MRRGFGGKGENTNDFLKFFMSVLMNRIEYIDAMDGATSPVMCDTPVTTSLNPRPETPHKSLFNGSHLLRLHVPDTPPNTQPPPNSHRHPPRYCPPHLPTYHIYPFLALLGQPSNILYSYLHTNFVRFLVILSFSHAHALFVEFGELPFDALSPGRPLRC